MVIFGKINEILVEFGKNTCYDSRQKTSFYVIDRNPCVIVDEPKKNERLKCVEINQVIANNEQAQKIGFIAIDQCLIQENNADFIVFKEGKLVFAELKMNMSVKDKLEKNVEDGVAQIKITKQFFNEKLLGLPKNEAFIGVPIEFTKSPTSTQKLEKYILDKMKMKITVGHKITI